MSRTVECYGYSAPRRYWLDLGGQRSLPYKREGRELNQSADFRDLATMRLREAKVLLDGSEWSGAYYLSGYAVECGIKACITKDLLAFQMPDKDVISKAYTHAIDVLADIASLKGPRVLTAQTDHDFAINWNIVTAWNESSRYLVWTETQAGELYEAITNANHGVFPWVRKFW